MPSTTSSSADPSIDRRSKSSLREHSAAVHVERSASWPEQVGRTMNTDHFDRWRRASNEVLLLKPEAAGATSMLGRIDAALQQSDAKYLQWRLDLGHLTSSQWEELHDSMATAHLWVLGAYELIRTLDELLRSRSDAASRELRQKSLAVKRQFERVRVPLAKL